VGRAYNYEHFVLSDEDAPFEVFPGLFNVGDPAPDGTLVDVNTGAETALSSLWKRDHLVMEFGSFT
jgi:hypothetical protein